MTLRRHFAPVVVCLALLGLAVYATGTASQKDGQSDPSGMALQYRPGAYFPEGLTLLGRVRLLSPPVVEMGKRTRVKVEYTVGDQGIEQGMAIEVWKHFTSDVEDLQIKDAEQPAFFAVGTTAPGVELEKQVFTNYAGPHGKNTVFPYRRAAAITIKKGKLSKGDQVLFDLGGAKGVGMQTWEENLFNFRVAVARGVEGKLAGYGGDAMMKVLGGTADRLKVQAPSIVGLGERFAVEVVPQDRYRSLARNHTGLELEIASADVPPAAFHYEPELFHYVARDVVADAEGVLRIEVRTRDGALRGVSNPIRVERHPLRRVFYGDLHQHTYLADGRGVFEELYLYARRTGLLDFGAITPHHIPLGVSGPMLRLDGVSFPRDYWPDLIRANKRMKGWQGFVPILAYEYSVGTNIGGHHNVFYRDDEAPTTMELEPSQASAPVARMLQILKRVGRPVIVIPHIGGGPPDWMHPTDQRMERLFEIASVHGVFEESYQKHLQAGVRLGASASGDTHTTSFGNANPGLEYPMTNGLTGVYANGRSRDDIWQGLYEKRTFAATGATRMLVDFDVNGEPMGGEVPSGHAATAKIRATISGTTPLVRVDLLKNSKVLYSVYPARQQGGLLRVTWGDNIYQRRANVGLTSGALTSAGGKPALKSVIHLDNSFEHIEQQGDAITWRTAAVSNDRDGFLADISGAGSGSLHFKLEDPEVFGTIDVDIPISELKQRGFFEWKRSRPAPADAKGDYMSRMGVERTFFLNCEMVSGDHPLDYEFSYEDRTPVKPGDYYYLRAEQLDTNKVWSSPVWID